MVKFLIVRTDFLGDSVLTSTFIRMLNQAVANSQIDILCGDYNLVAFQYNPLIKSIFQIKNNHIVNQELFNNDYDAVFLLNRDRKTYILLAELNTKVFVGHYLGKKSFRSRLFNLKAIINKKYHLLIYNDSIHEVENQYNVLLKYLSFAYIGKIPNLDNNCYFYTQNFNPEVDYIAKDNQVVVLNISGRKETNRYIPTEMAIQIINLVVQLNKQVILIATVDDKLRADTILGHTINNSVKLICERDIFKLAEQIAKYQYFIGADGGLLHIAAGLHMCCVGLFHAQRIESWRPWTLHQVCLQTASKKLHEISSEDIINALIKLEMSI